MLSQDEAFDIESHDGHLQTPMDPHRGDYLQWCLHPYLSIEIENRLQTRAVVLKASALTPIGSCDTWSSTRYFGGNIAARCHSRAWRTCRPSGVVLLGKGEASYSPKRTMYIGCKPGRRTQTALVRHFSHTSVYQFPRLLTL